MKPKTLLTILGMSAMMGCASAPSAEPQRPQVQERSVSIGDQTFHISQEREEVFVDGSLMVTAQVDGATWTYRVDHGCDGEIAQEIFNANGRNPKRFVAAMNDKPIDDGIDSFVLSGNGANIALYKVNGRWRGTNTGTRGMQGSLQDVTQFMRLARDILNVQSRYGVISNQEGFYNIFRHNNLLIGGRQLRENSSGQLVFQRSTQGRGQFRGLTITYTFGPSHNGYQIRAEVTDGQELMIIDEVGEHLRIRGRHTEFMETDNPDNPICYDRSGMVTSYRLRHIMIDARDMFDILERNYNDAIRDRATRVVRQFGERQ